MPIDAPTMDVLRKQAIAMAMLWLTARDYQHEGGTAWFHVRPRDLGLRDDVLPGKRIRVSIEAEPDTPSVAARQAGKTSGLVDLDEDTVRVPFKFLREFLALAHNYSLTAEPPDFYDGLAGDAFRNAYARCGRDLAALRSMLVAYGVQAGVTIHLTRDPATGEVLRDDTPGMPGRDGGQQG